MPKFENERIGQALGGPALFKIAGFEYSLDFLVLFIKEKDSTARFYGQKTIFS
jgi:hypothetical protein